MFVRGLTFFILLSLVLPVGANYDTEQIKQLITEKDSLFQVTQWRENDQPSSWTATSTIKWLSVEIASNKTEVGSPYFNPATRAAAQERCNTIASFALRPTTDEQLAAINKVLAKATQHHQPQRYELNNVRFEAIPVLQGVFVRLFCSVTPLSTSNEEG